MCELFLTPAALGRGIHRLITAAPDQLHRRRGFRNPFRISCSALVLACLICSPLLLKAQKTLTSGSLGGDGLLRLEIRSVFDPLPPSGYAPLRIVASNGSRSELPWKFSTLSKTRQFRHENEHHGHFTLLTSPGSTQSATFLAPMAVDYGAISMAYRNNSHQLEVAVDVAGRDVRTFQEYHSRTHGFPALAISKRLADGHHSKLKDAVETQLKGRPGGTSNFFGSEFNPSDLPEDWLGLSGFDFLMISHQEWQALKPGQQFAVLQWVRLYGNLHVYATDGITAAGLGLPEGFQNDRKDHSLGNIQIIRWDGRSLDPASTVGRYLGAPIRTTDLTSAYSILRSGQPAWGLLSALGRRDFASWQVVVFLMLFGIVVGPVNLFVFAPPGRRHRLFITTPLLSIGASLLMVGIILVQDGMGGTGTRLVAIDLEPHEAAAYVTQEQACRTGMLLGSGFEMKQAALVEPVAMPDTPWSKLKSSSNSQVVQLAQAGPLRSGNYFQSRTEQGQVLRAVVSTRARLELKSGQAAGAAPEIISALGFTLEDLFYFDAEGRVWRASGPVMTGQQVPLRASEAAALRASLTNTLELAGGSHQSRLKAFMQGTPPRNTFLAAAKATPGFVLDTLPSVRWEQDHVLVFGTLAQP